MRIEDCIQYCMEQGMQEGHLYQYRQQLQKKVHEQLNRGATRGNPPGTGGECGVGEGTVHCQCGVGVPERERGYIHPSRALFEGLWECLDMKLYFMAKGISLMEKGYKGVFESLPEEKQSVLIGRKSDFAEKAGIYL